jgi:hypothetical protein
MVVHDAFGLSVWRTTRSYQEIYAQNNLSKHHCLGARVGASSLSLSLSLSLDDDDDDAVLKRLFETHSLSCCRSNLWQRLSFYTQVAAGLVPFQIGQCGAGGSSRGFQPAFMRFKITVH